jgi:BirA family biotin operon repressor/biotin-[acetyl-CoA-carboxylase] ligase
MNMRRLAIHSPFNAPVYHAETVGSTMDVSRLLAADGEPHGTVITADFQEAGRGRGRERTWDTDRGKNLPFTILLRYGRIEAIPPALTLRAGLAVALAIEDFAPSLTGAITVKWPNDVMIRAAGGVKKAAGILTEAEGGTVHIGIGINVAQTEFPGFLRDTAISINLALGGETAPAARFTLLEKTLFRLYRELETPEGNAGTGNALDWRERLEQQLYQKGEQVAFIAGAPGSDRIVEGRLAGIGAGGELLLVPKGETGARPFITGELALTVNKLRA